MSLHSPSRGDRAPARTANPRPRRERYPNLSPTRPPAVAHDQALWPAIADEWSEHDGWVWTVTDAHASEGGR